MNIHIETTMTTILAFAMNAMYNLNHKILPYDEFTFINYIFQKFGAQIEIVCLAMTFYEMY